MKKSIVNALLAIMSFMAALLIGALSSSKLFGFPLVASFFLLIGMYFIQRANKYYKLEPGYTELTIKQKKSKNARMLVMVIGGLILMLIVLYKNLL